jgi:hypothetical protein
VNAVAHPTIVPPRIAGGSRTWQSANSECLSDVTEEAGQPHILPVGRYSPSQRMVDSFDCDQQTGLHLDQGTPGESRAREALSGMAGNRLGAYLHQDPGSPRAPARRVSEHGAQVIVTSAMERSNGASPRTVNI